LTSRSRFTVADNARTASSNVAAGTPESISACSSDVETTALDAISRVKG
jgi:hypothetical protein